MDRGHTIEQAHQAFEYLKRKCFKIDIHLMPQLPGSNPDEDKKMFDTIYNSSQCRPDQIKIYPCEVVPWTKISGTIR